MPKPRIGTPWPNRLGNLLARDGPGGDMARTMRWICAGLLVVLAGYLCFLALQPAPVESAAFNVDAPEGPSQQLSALFVGDGYAAGAGAASRAEAWSCLTARSMGWICNLDAQEGTGFLADGRQHNASYAPLLSRLSDTRARYLADVVIVDAGRWDADADTVALTDAMVAYLRAVRAAWPKAELVAIEPYRMDSPEPVLDEVETQALRDELKRLNGAAIDPIGAGWIDPAVTGRLTAANGVQPNTAGHEYIAKHVTAALRDLGLDDARVTDTRSPLAS